MGVFRIGLAVLGICLVSSVGKGGFEFNIVPSQAVYNSNGVTPVSGYFDVVLNLTGADLVTPPTNVGSFNFAYTLPTALGFSSTTDIGTGSGGLMNGNVSNSSAPPNSVLYAKDLNGGSVTAFNGAILGRFNFTTTTGASATYNVTAGAPIFQELANNVGTPFAGLTVNSGTITVSAVPEPTSLGLAGIAFGAFAIRRWKQKRKTAAQV